MRECFQESQQADHVVGGVIVFDGEAKHANLGGAWLGLRAARSVAGDPCLQGIAGPHTPRLALIETGTESASTQCPSAEDSNRSRSDDERDREKAVVAQHQPVPQNRRRTNQCEEQPRGRAPFGAVGTGPDSSSSAAAPSRSPLQKRVPSKQRAQSPQKGTHALQDAAARRPMSAGRRRPSGAQIGGTTGSLGGGGSCGSGGRVTPSSATSAWRSPRTGSSPARKRTVLYAGLRPITQGGAAGVASCTATAGSSHRISRDGSFTLGSNCSSNAGSVVLAASPEAGQTQLGGGSGGVANSCMGGAGLVAAPGLHKMTMGQKTREMEALQAEVAVQEGQLRSLLHAKDGEEVPDKVAFQAARLWVYLEGIRSAIFSLQKQIVEDETEDVGSGSYATATTPTEDARSRHEEPCGSGTDSPDTCSGELAVHGRSAHIPKLEAAITTSLLRPPLTQATPAQREPSPLGSSRGGRNTLQPVRQGAFRGLLRGTGAGGGASGLHRPGSACTTTQAVVAAGVNASGSVCGSPDRSTFHGRAGNAAGGLSTPLGQPAPSLLTQAQSDSLRSRPRTDRTRSASAPRGSPSSRGSSPARQPQPHWARNAMASKYRSSAPGTLLTPGDATGGLSTPLRQPAPSSLTQPQSDALRSRPHTARERSTSAPRGSPSSRASSPARQPQPHLARITMANRCRNSAPGTLLTPGSKANSAAPMLQPPKPVGCPPT